ncbi:MAG: hypothetical protein ACLPND_08945 [Candidatus Korobacteraceae bacterium]
MTARTSSELPLGVGRLFFRIAPLINSSNVMYARSLLTGQKLRRFQRSANPFANRGSTVQLEGAENEEKLLLVACLARVGFCGGLHARESILGPSNASLDGCLVAKNSVLSVTIGNGVLSTHPGVASEKALASSRRNGESRA